MFRRISTTLVFAGTLLLGACGTTGGAGTAGQAAPTATGAMAGMDHSAIPGMSGTAALKKAASSATSSRACYEPKEFMEKAGTSLEYADSITTTGREVSDALFARLREHYAWSKGLR